MHHKIPSIKMKCKNFESQSNAKPYKNETVMILETDTLIAAEDKNAYTNAQQDK